MVGEATIQPFKYNQCPNKCQVYSKFMARRKNGIIRKSELAV
jgi:hypothetical protein